MKIKNHRLLKEDGTPFTFAETPNVGGRLEPKYLVMHFTAGSSLQESVGWLTSPKAKASAHLVIGRDGSITQLVPFNKVAWHAGASSWEGLQGMNQYSLGIELDNAGKLTRKGDGWRAWFGTDYDNSQVIEAVHKFETEACGWQTYTPEQMSAAVSVGSLLMAQYGLLDVIGHEDIAPHRKCDPGPAFPMASFRGRLAGRSENERIIYRTTTELNIRSGPGAENTMLPGSPLPADTEVRLILSQGNWWKVDVANGTGSTADLEGWVNSRFLARAG